MSRGDSVLKICAIYDTETNRVGDSENSKSFVILYQINDLRSVPLKSYVPNITDDIRFYRNEESVVEYFADLADWGVRNHVIPVVCAYNLTFDMQTIITALMSKWRLETLAQSSVNWYTVDCVNRETGVTVLRFWDTFFLCPSGLKQMGEIAGLPKATGDWDYDLQRTPETPLTVEERFYAARDVQVIPAYLRYLMATYSWVDEGMFSKKIITKTSLVRRYAEEYIAPIKTGKKKTVGSDFLRLCKKELPHNFRSYALRKACFRGGLSFTSALTANVPQRNVASLDVTSMHHTFIPCRVPVGFVETDPQLLSRYVANILKTPLNMVLVNYIQPFKFAIHAVVRFQNLRLRVGTCYEKWGIATLARAKFASKLTVEDDTVRNDSVALQEEITRRTFRDTRSDKAIFAFGKLYECADCTVCLTEIELYIMRMVYEWDSIEVVSGESTYKWESAPAYVGLQSQHWYATKNDVKQLTKIYTPNTPLPADTQIGRFVAVSMADAARRGDLTARDLSSYYLLVKEMFNSIYGTQAQDIYKSGYMFDDEGDVVVNPDDVTTCDTFDERTPSWTRVMYTYGMRIVGRSRLHLIIAMALLYDALGGRVMVTGGDTDSLKIACDSDVTDAELLGALAPLHNAADMVMTDGYANLREFYPDMCVDMRGIGRFDVEDCGVKGVKRYPWHIEFWVKCRVSIDVRGGAHVTCAGLSRPEDTWNIESVYEQLAGVYSPFYALTHGIGYNVVVAPDTANFLQRNRPKTTSRVRGRVADYAGNVVFVNRHEAQSLWKAPRVLGSTVTSRDNADNVRYLERVYGRRVDTSNRVITMSSLGATKI